MRPELREATMYERNADGWDVQRGRLTRADRVKGGWEVEHEGGWGTFWLTDEKAGGVEPKVGDESVWYMSNFSLVRGVEINGKRLFYTTKEQAEQEQREYVENRRRKQQAELDEQRADRDQRRSALPEPLRARLDRYESRNPDWRRDYESYELFVCEQAAILAALPKSGDIGEWYDRFRALSYKQQKAAWPGLSDDHSGNTFDAARVLAYQLDMGRRDAIVNGHGAMTPLVGCEDYGCHSEAEFAPSSISRNGG